MKKHTAFAIVIMMTAISGGVSHAQVIDPQTQPGIPFPAPPPSRIDKPVQVPPQPPGQGRESFGDRVQRCLDQAAAQGYDPNGRAAYSRVCANQ